MSRPCPHCRQTLPEGERFTTHKGKAKPMICCERCKPRLDRRAPDFKVERNFKSAGTSSDAASAAAKSARLNDTHRKIWAALRKKPMTPDEVARECGLVLNTARARVNDLKDAGYVRATGERRPTEAGRMADVIMVTQAQGQAA